MNNGVLKSCDSLLASPKELLTAAFLEMGPVLLFLLALCSLWSLGRPQEGTKCLPVPDQPSCVAECPDGKIDLTPIAEQGLEAPRFKGMRDVADYIYTFNPCHPYSEGLCENVHACQSSEYNPYLQYSIASAGTEQIMVDNEGNPYIYYQGPSSRTVHVNLHCTGDKTTSVTAKGDQEQFFVYKFDAYGCDVCPGGCKSSGGGAGGIEGGIGIAIMVLALAGVVAYFVIGVIVMKVKYKAEGVDLFPNRLFWMSVPFLIKDGFLFTISPCRRKDESYSEVK